MADLKADVVACVAFEREGRPSGVKDSGLRKELSTEMKAEKFKAHAGDVLAWNTDERYGSRRFLVIGLGKKGKNFHDALRAGCAIAARAASKIHCKTLAVRLPDGGGVDPVEEVRAAAEGLHYGSYYFDRYITDAERKPVRLTSVEIAAPANPAKVRKGAELGGVVARGVCLARDLVNDPPSRMDPVAMARVAVAEGRKNGLTVKVHNRREMEKLGFKAMLAVARGSKAEPRFVHMKWKPAKVTARTPRIVLVGKGVTFDSGGLNLKPAGGMLTMKCDMGVTPTNLETFWIRIRVKRSRSAIPTPKDAWCCATCWPGPRRPLNRPPWLTLRR